MFLFYNNITWVCTHESNMSVNNFNAVTVISDVKLLFEGKFIVKITLHLKEKKLFKWRCL